MPRVKDKDNIKSKCIECGFRSAHLMCRKCKESWRGKVLDLHNEGVGPLSIAVRINKPWSLVVKFLIKKGLIDDG